MSNTLVVVLIGVGVVLLLAVFYIFKKFKKADKVKKDKTKIKKVKAKEKKIKVKKKADYKNRIVDLKGSYVDVVDKFLFRKEIKVLILVSRLLPKGYIAFPKVGVDLILVPIGNRNLYELIHGKYIDIVIFEEETMKPRVAIDLFDGSIGDEQLDVESPEVLKALQVAELPLISIRVKNDYNMDEVRLQIAEALGRKEDKK